MCRRIKTIVRSKSIRYAVCLIDLNEYLDSFHRDTLSDKIGVTEPNKILLNSMPNSWSTKSYVQGFDCEYISFKKSVNMLEQMNISESFYEGVVEPSDKKPTRADANSYGYSRNKRG